MRLRRPRLKGTPVQPLDLSKRPKGAQSTATITEAASRDTRGLIIAAIHLVFVSIRGRFTATQLQPMLMWRQPRSIRRQPCGGPAIMIMQPVNSGVPGIWGVVIVPPAITGTRDPPFPAASALTTLSMHAAV